MSFRESVVPLLLWLKPAIDTFFLVITGGIFVMALAFAAVARDTLGDHHGMLFVLEALVPMALLWWLATWGWLEVRKRLVEIDKR